MAPGTAESRLGRRARAADQNKVHFLDAFNFNLTVVANLNLAAPIIS
eukprot:CAMPEP_0172637250 /NCGR_PEP_ID=MMETSP1068-20121228/207996_1 /TAXON_ID=35684 /ORGANISM="Pseudopedinella elastica, Strain CCMP716" /LENGTH=46 /DNA_ID= /DNA_START= /DNA_END= /DNA_ORIENTATION=